MKSNSYMREYMKNRWKKRRANAIHLLGGICVNCGTTENLEFDHVDASYKDFSISRASSYSEERWLKELEKCQLLCHTCHLAKSSKNGDMADRCRTTICSCGRSFYTIKSFAGHKRWCTMGG